MKYLYTVLLLISYSYCCAEQSKGGYVVGNFSISAQISEDDGPVSLIKTNPPKLGVWLQNFGNGQVWIEERNGQRRRLKLRRESGAREYPEYHAVFDAEGKVQIEVDAFAPIGLRATTNFIPVILYRVRVVAAHPWEGAVGYTLQQAQTAPGENDDDPTPWAPEISSFRGNRHVAVSRGPAFVGLAARDPSSISHSKYGEPLSVSTLLRISAGGEETLTFLVGRFDPDGAYTVQADTPNKLLTEVVSRIDPLTDELRAFVEMIPRTGDARIDHYLPWYMSAGILLTKGDREGHILTMGYRELNPRDSFWTSGIHLVFWKELERRMIQELASSQRPDGRITSTILPIIDRGDEIDSSIYFILRVARYYRWYRDEALLKQLWLPVQKAIAYLVSRDSDHVGVPKQTSYWADWKDVSGVQGRTYAPDFALLWLASLREASELAEALRDKSTATQYMKLGDLAEKFINKPWDHGGLWNGHNYADRWTDGRRPNYVMEDQVLGAFFDVIPRDRLEPLYQQLRENETPWGVRETFPYHSNWTEEMGGTPGNYHNGGIWPYLNFVDVADRYLYGSGVDAERILHEVGNADLDASGEQKPREFLNGNTGANAGSEVQGWDAALFSTVYFGAFGISRPSSGQIDISVHIPPGRDFSTRLMLPECQGTLSRHAGKLAWSEVQEECSKKGIIVSAR